MLDITLLRKDLDSVIARLQTRKHPQAFLDFAAFSAQDAEGKERVSNQILANVVQFIGGRKEEKELTATAAEPVTVMSDEEIPF